MTEPTHHADGVVVAIVGATGTGKSTLSIELAEALAARGHRAEIINADAMQLYQGMDIGTAKLSVVERKGIPHHLLDVLTVTDDASVARYQLQARSVARQIWARGALPIMVGGSGLYVSSVLYDFRFPGTDPGIRARLEAELLDHGSRQLHRRLAQVDPAAANAIGEHNGRRLVRALEVVELTGQPFGAGLPSETAYWAKTVTIGLKAPRQDLVARLNDRVRAMWQDGLLQEVRQLLPAGLAAGVTASRAIGYAQAIEQLAGRLTEEEAIEQTSALTRKYARRQVGWFNRYPDTAWLNYDDPALVKEAMQLVLSGG